VTLSFAQAEYVGATIVACETVWMRRILIELLHEQQEPTHIFCDNKSLLCHIIIFSTRRICILIQNIILFES
jgi:hypothetical protein